MQQQYSLCRNRLVLELSDFMVEPSLGQQLRELYICEWKQKVSWGTDAFPWVIWTVTILVKEDY